MTEDNLPDINSEFTAFAQRIFAIPDSTNLTISSVCIVRYKILGPRYLLLQQATQLSGISFSSTKEISETDVLFFVKLLGKAVSTFRDRSKRLGVRIINETRSSVIQAIRRVDSSIRDTTSHLALLKCRDVEKVFLEFQVSSLLVDEIRLWNKANPEPVNHQPGRLGGSESQNLTPSVVLQASIPTQVTTLPLPLTRSPRERYDINYIFPTTLPSVNLTPDQRRETYGMADHMLSARLRLRLGDYFTWCSGAINTSRSIPYTNAVQSSTIQSYSVCIR
jgi:hypothetical protein